MANRIYTAIGLMSGTSLDGVDVALIKTDGQSTVERVDFATCPYAAELRETVRAAFGKGTEDVSEAEDLITRAHIQAVRAFGHKADIIGFHGQTIFHDPKNGITRQIGDGQRLARETGMDVVFDFRSADVKAGGQGAPLIPLYHQVLARAAGLPTPVAVLNIGGVSNITYIGEGDTDVIAFDTGPGNALIDDWMLRQTGQPFDENGEAAKAGVVDEVALQTLLGHPYFSLPAPKSLDRDAFSAAVAQHLSVNDGAATLAAFTADAVLRGFDLLPQKPVALYVTGGGRKNGFIMQRLVDKLRIPVDSVDRLGWNGDAMEAEGFAYLAVRSLLGLPLSLPGTTGCPVPMTGGRLARVS